MQSSAPLISYVQGRYICAHCGEFDVLYQEHESAKREHGCPKCFQPVGLVSECRGKSLHPEFGATRVRDLSLTEFDSSGEPRVIASRSTGRPRKQAHCEPCGRSAFNSRAGAEYQAAQMQIQYGAPYDSIACPQGNGFHVYPRKSPDAAA